jgi:uncharacterized protein (DUF305 family)
MAEAADSHGGGHGAHPQQHGTAASRAGAACSPSRARIDAEAYAAYTTDMHAGMSKMMREMHADPPSGDPDIDFLAMMIPHHDGAVEMARLVLRTGRDPLVREIAEKILETQIAEMAGMRGRLAALRRCDPDYPSLTGNRGD